jgi:Zn-dependent M28 family amino/carboxypeptidase
MFSNVRFGLLFKQGCFAFMFCAVVAGLIGPARCAAAEPAAGTPDQIAAALAQKALTNSGAMEIITDLTTENGPRLAGTDAEKRAAAWAKRRFEQLGFDKVWIETFPLEHSWVRGVEQAEVISPFPQPLVITALGGSVATPPGGLEAEIALFKTYAELLALPTNSLTGKIAVVTQPMIRGRPEAGYGALHQLRSAGPAEAARRGAVGFLLRSLGTDNLRRPHTGETRYADDAPRIPAAALSAPDAEQLERLTAKGAPVRVRILLTPRDPGPATSQNVIAEIKGREKPDDLILLGAHLDSWDLGTGAVDDGAGVAMVMAAGKMIRDLPQRPKRTIRVVLFGSEEFGLFGGKAYADKHKAELNHFVILAEPDVGQGPVVGFQTGVANPDDPSLKRIRAALAPLGIVAGDNRSRGDSDTEPMVDAGVPAATLRLDASDYFDLHHTPDDTLDKIKPERLNQSTAAYAVFAYLAAELDGDYRAKPADATK